MVIGRGRSFLFAAHATAGVSWNVFDGVYTTLAVISFSAVAFYANVVYGRTDGGVPRGAVLLVGGWLCHSAGCTI